MKIYSMESVVLGGTHQENDFDMTVREKDSKFIREGCERVYPSIQVLLYFIFWEIFKK